MRFVDVLIGTLSEGALLVLSAIGIVLIYKTTRVMNFAHGFISALSGYLAYEFVTVHELPFLLAVAAGILAGALAGFLCGAVMGRLGGHSPLELVIATFGIGYLLQWAIEAYWGHDELAVARPFGEAALSIGGIALPYYTILITVVSFVLVLGLAALINRTDLGLRIRSTFDDPVAARLTGIRISRVRSASWTVGGALGGAAGVLLAPILYLSPNRMLLILLLAFSAAVIGGFTSLYGTIAGGLVVAFVKQAGSAFVSVEYSNLILYAVVIAFLCVRPYGLFGDPSEDDHARVEGESSWDPVGRLAKAVRARPAFLARPRSVRPTWSVLSGGTRHALTPLLFLVVLPLVAGFRDLTVLSFLILFIAVLGVTLGTFYAGQISMGQIAFLALGMFTTARVVDGRPDLWWLGILASTALSLVVSALVAIPFSRLRGAYFAVVTLAIALATPEILYKWSDVTGGGAGLVVPSPGLSSAAWYYVVAFFATAVYLGLIALRGSSVGRSVVAVRDNPDAARTLGIQVGVARVMVFTATSTLGGLAGALYALTMGFVGPETFGLHHSILIFVAAVVSKSLFGSVWGTALITWVPILLSGSSAANAVYGVVLLIVVFLIPGDFSSLDVVRRHRDRAFGGPNSRTNNSSTDQSMEESCSVTGNV